MTPNLSFPAGTNAGISGYGMPVYPGNSNLALPTFAAPETSLMPVMPNTPAPGTTGLTPVSGTTSGTTPINDSWFSKTFMNEGGGMNLDNIGAVLKGVGSLGSLWGGIQANKIAKDSLNFQKDSYNTNLNNQISTFNTALEDRAYARAAQNGTGNATAEGYIARHKLGE